MKRTDNGTVIIRSSSEEDMYKQLGYAHAKDRGLQMLIMRILGKGRASELLDGSEVYDWYIYNPGSDQRIKDVIKHMMRLEEFQLR